MMSNENQIHDNISDDTTSKLIKNLSDSNISISQLDKSKLPNLTPKDQSVSQDGNQE